MIDQRILWALSGTGMLVTFLCLILTTPITMTLFFFIALPCFGLGIMLYTIDIAARIVRRTKSESDYKK